MSDGSIGASVPITASAISAVLNCLFGRESKSSDSTNLGMFSKSDTASFDNMSSGDSSFSEKKYNIDQGQYITRFTHGCPTGFPFGRVSHSAKDKLLTNISEDYLLFLVTALFFFAISVNYLLLKLTEWIFVIVAIVPLKEGALKRSSLVPDL